MEQHLQLVEALVNQGLKVNQIENHLLFLDSKLGIEKPIFNIVSTPNEFSISFNPYKQNEIFLRLIDSFSTHPEGMAFWKKKEGHELISDLITINVQSLCVGLEEKEIYNIRSKPSLADIEHPFANLKSTVVNDYKVWGRVYDLSQNQEEGVEELVQKAREKLNFANGFLSKILRFNIELTNSGQPGYSTKSKTKIRPYIGAILSNSDYPVIINLDR